MAEGEGEGGRKGEGERGGEGVERLCAAGWGEGRLSGIWGMRRPEAEKRRYARLHPSDWEKL